MSALAAAASDEDGDTIKQLRKENEQLRQALLTANDTLGKVAMAGALHAQAALCLRETVIRWAARAEQAEEMLEAIGAGGVGSTVARQGHPEQHLEMVPAGWKLVPVEPTIPMLHRADGLTCIDFVALGEEGAFDLDELKEIYRAMIAAAPQPPMVEQPQGEQEPNPRWPSNASEVRAFLSGRVATERYARDDHQPDDNDTYTLSAHDLLEAINWWTDFDTQPKRQPLTEEQILKLAYPLRWDEVDDFEADRAINFAQAIERAHGIGGEA